MSLAERGGEEHRLWLAEDGHRYFKATFPGRFVKDTQGVVLPIDLILLRASDALQQAMAPFLP